MSLIEMQKIAVEGIAANKVRSGLTTLGVVIGVAAVIMLVSVGDGARADISKQIEGLGSNLVIVLPGGAGKLGRGRALHGGGSVNKLSYDIALKIEQRSSIPLKVAPSVIAGATVKYRSKSTETQIGGITPNYTTVRNWPMAEGRFITKSELEGKRRVCTIGQTVLKEVFGTSAAVGKIITIKGVRFKVVGVMSAKGMLGSLDMDDYVYMPLTTSQDLFGVNYISLMSIAAPSSTEVDHAMREVKRVMLKYLDRDDFVMNTQQDYITAFEEIMNVMTIMLGSIAGISLLVGGIGIMNIMLVSVTERTREIGLRKALGATETSILMQFLLEAVTLSILGGLIGVLIGSAGSRAIDRFSELTTKITPWSVCLAFFSAFLVGVFFGVYPAKKASEMDPIVALRYE